MDSAKECRHRGVVKPLTDFSGDSAARAGRRPECKSCTGARRAAWYAENRDREIQRVQDWRRANKERSDNYQRERRQRPDVKRREREGHLRRKYGMTLEQYDALLLSQGGGCGICGRRPEGRFSLHVDHDHETGVVRGILCFRCNNAVGDLQNDPTLARAVAAYLDRVHRADTDAEELDELARVRARALVRA